MMRPAAPSDLGAIMALERASFPTDAWSETMMREELVSTHAHYVVLEEAGRVVGYGGVRAARGLPDADIQTLALDPQVRGRGQGRALLRALVGHARDSGAKKVFLEVRADNSVAHSLYVSEGFGELGRRPRYYQPDGVDAIVMELDLRTWAPQGEAEPTPAEGGRGPREGASG
ncbi:ribosomal protein S18-alanine N-acetyltransferase [Microbacterium sp. NPDC078428]|uniref:ribosomal protein S18-alanine N-acetyltransferase n=1 Tax=Microbacterium sp. NPDC078428 TaxID=3364190 RepID=UPI0037C525FE